MITKTQRVRRVTLTGLALTILSCLVLAGSNSTTLPNGASLTVSITDPVTSTEFQVPHDQSTIDVTVSGSASIGVGESDGTIVYVIDTSGSTDSGSGTGCSPILGCEKQFFVGLNNAAIADGSIDLAGVVSYASSASINQSLADPSNPAVANAINSLASSGGTNCAAGLSSAQSLVSDVSNTNGTSLVVFASDGLCNLGGSVATAASALGGTGAIVYSVAVGTGSNCTSDGGTGTLNQIPQNGGSCIEVADPGNLPDIIPNLIGSTLQSLEIAVDGGTAQAIPNSDISDCTLPVPGAATCHYQTTVPNLGPGDHEICVTAYGSDVTGGTANVTQCETIHLLKLTAAPSDETNELGSDNQHTVTATILGDSAQVGGRKVDFAVTGQNPTSESDGTCSPNADCTTDASGQVSFTYTVPVEPESLGTDTITVSTTIASTVDSVDLKKDWIDTTPPVAQCVETVNPHGKNTPKAPGTGQNEDGFYRLLATDDVWPADALEVYVTDGGSGTVFGPFSVGTNIKYTEANGTTPTMKAMGSSKGNAGAITAHITGNGDAQLTAVDGSGNVSDPVSCLVAPPPK